MSDFSDWESELYHHGILGMKWGIRRYRNPDGTLTEAGKRHLNAKYLTDKELEDRVKRLRMEDEERKLNKGRVARAFEYARAYNKERAENQKNRASLLTAKAAMRAKNPFFVSANKLSEGLGNTASKFVDKTIEKVSDDFVSLLPSKENVAEAKTFVWKKMKEANAAYKQYQKDLGKAIKEGRKEV